MVLRLVSGACEGEQDADAEIEAVEHDIHEDGQGEDRRPDQGKVKRFHAASPPL